MTPSFWHWWILAALLVLIEVMAPGFVFVWLAVGAFLTGLLLLFLPQVSWELQLLNFAILGLVAVGGWLVLARRLRARGGDERLNRRGSNLIGGVYRLEEAIVDGRGRARVGDGSWTVTGPDLPAGAAVRVLRLDNTRLVVEAARDAEEGPIPPPPS
ncbi:MAG: NfeD family protein [Geminicoccaceae bacterium]|nr:NfeD family protein [Geminicoccaceae bacterium]